MFGVGKTSNDKVTKLISDTFIQLFSDKLPPVENLHHDVRTILDKKRGRYNTEDEYIHSLLFNVGHYIISHERIIESFMKSLNQGELLSLPEIQNSIISTKEDVRNQQESWIGRFEKSFSRFERVEKIDELEFNYLFSSSTDQILLSALMTIQTEGRIFNQLKAADHEFVKGTLIAHVGLYTNVMIGNVNSNAA